MTGMLAVSALLCALSTDAPSEGLQAREASPDLELGLDHASGGTPALALSLRLLGADDETQPAEEGAPEADGGRTRTLRRWGRGLRWTTAIALVGTSTLGTMAAINQPTAFSDGRCATGSPVLGTYGCDRGLSTLHGASGVLSATLYTANAVLGLAAPESRGTVSLAARRWHRALGYVHLGGIVIQPVIGLVSAFPQVIGRERTAPADPFPRDLRTVHVCIGYLTTAAFLTSVLLER